MPRHASAPSTQTVALDIQQARKAPSPAAGTPRTAVHDVGKPEPAALQPAASQLAAPQPADRGPAAPQPADRGPADHGAAAREAAALEAAAREADAAGTRSDLDGAAGMLIEAACQWRLAGDPERCRALLDMVLVRGGPAGCFARTELIGILLEEGATDAALAELDTLAADPALAEGPCQMLGELLTDHGMLTAALEWYDRAVGYWAEERRAAAMSGSRGMDRILLQQRQRVCKRLGR